MILVDTSVWVEHLRVGNEMLSALVERRQVLGHSFVTGELALADLRGRDAILRALQSLPQATVASDEEIFHFIDRQMLFGRAIGYVDAHLLAAAQRQIVDARSAPASGGGPIRCRSALALTGIGRPASTLPSRSNSHNAEQAARVPPPFDQPPILRHIRREARGESAGLDHVFSPAAGRRPEQ